MPDTPEGAPTDGERKRRAAADHPDDIRAYTEAEAECIDSVLESAR